MTLRFTRYQYKLLLILTLINFVNYIDRVLINPLFVLIKKDFEVSDLQLGLLITVFIVVQSCASIPFGWLADRVSRTRLITYGVLFWSAVTFVTGTVQSFRQLLIARSLLGVGEAVYAPAAVSMISGAYPQEFRARVQSFFNMGMLAGATLALAAGGIIGEWKGWRPAFFLVGVPGLLLGLMVFRLKEPPSLPLPRYTGAKASGLGAGSKSREMVPVKLLFRVPAYVALLASGTLITFAAGAIGAWGPTFVTRYQDFSLKEAGVTLGAILLVAVMTGVLTGGWVADSLERRWPQGRALTIATAFLVSVPVILWALFAPTKGQFLFAFFVAAFFMSWYHGPVTAIIHDLIPARAHATAFGVYMFVVHLLGDAPSSALVGAIADRWDLRAGLLVALAMQLIGAIGFLGVANLIRHRGMIHPALERFRALPSVPASGH
ncbi:MAG TPA: MFS transporter [Candidatus Acidoferrales bacterium]